MIYETLLTLQASCNIDFEDKTNQKAWDWVLTVLLAVFDCFSLHSPE